MSTSPPSGYRIGRATEAEARRFAHTRLTTVHLLLAALAEPHGVVAAAFGPFGLDHGAALAHLSSQHPDRYGGYAEPDDALRRLGLDTDVLLTAGEATFGKGALDFDDGWLELHPYYDRTMAKAPLVAEVLGDDETQPLHLVLAALEITGARDLNELLDAFGLDAQSARAALLDAAGVPDPAKGRFLSRRARRSADRDRKAADVAATVEDARVEPEDLDERIEPLLAGRPLAADGAGPLDRVTERARAAGYTVLDRSGSGPITRWYVANPSLRQVFVASVRPCPGGVKIGVTHLPPPWVHATATPF